MEIKSRSVEQEQPRTDQLPKLEGSNLQTINLQEISLASIEIQVEAQERHHRQTQLPKRQRI